MQFTIYFMYLHYIVYKALYKYNRLYTIYFIQRDNIFCIYRLYSTRYISIDYMDVMCTILYTIIYNYYILQCITEIQIDLLCPGTLTRIIYMCVSASERIIKSLCFIFTLKREKFLSQISPRGNKATLTSLTLLTQRSELTTGFRS